MFRVISQPHELGLNYRLLRCLHLNICAFLKSKKNMIPHLIVMPYCQREGIVFLPLPVETLGGWHETAVQQIRKLAAALSRQTGEEESVATSHLYHKGNSALIPTFPDSHIDRSE